ncbi:Rv3235 family protein [Leifsonia sp. NPDC058194]|uniref:Rv3235 family protein n=1 Tax=Leifsonia sp. NPDC058194 TaxID=3346374 RepID=UPI0036DC79DC
MSTRATTIEQPASSAPTRATDLMMPNRPGSAGDRAEALPEAARRSFAAHPANHRPHPRPQGIETRTTLESAGDDDRPAGTRRRADADADVATLDQDPALLCANLALCVVEILAGARALDQIGRWVTDSVFVHLLRRTVIAARSRAVAAQEAMRPRFRIGAPLLSHPADGIVEAVVMVHQPTRSRAIALRLERHRERWRATAISVL